jgi:hypothetical protein
MGVGDRVPEDPAVNKFLGGLHHKSRVVGRDRLEDRQHQGITCCDGKFVDLIANLLRVPELQFRSFCGMRNPALNSSSFSIL